MVVTVGVDVREVDRGAVAVAAAGRRPGEQPTVRATGTGHRDLPRRVPWGSAEQAVQFTVEDRRHAPPRRAGRTCLSRHPSRTDTAAPARLPAAA
jgi:hypothetical protein